jgi:hypothetical protein
MVLARVKGTVVATHKSASMEGLKLLLLERIDAARLKGTGEYGVGDGQRGGQRGGGGVLCHWLLCADDGYRQGQALGCDDHAMGQPGRNGSGIKIERRGQSDGSKRTD